MFCRQVKVWEIPPHGLLKNLTVPWKELQGHRRRVGLIEWHPTANNILFSTGYDYQVSSGGSQKPLTRHGSCVCRGPTFLSGDRKARLLLLGNAAVVAPYFMKHCK